MLRIPPMPCARHPSPCPVWRQQWVAPCEPSSSHDAQSLRPAACVTSQMCALGALQALEAIESMAGRQVALSALLSAAEEQLGTAAAPGLCGPGAATSGGVGEATRICQGHCAVVARVVDISRASFGDDPAALAGLLAFAQDAAAR